MFSGLKLDLGLHRKAGLRMYPHRPLARKRPWFRSICSPGVWKFRATAQQHRVRGQWPLTCTELNVLLSKCRQKNHVASLARSDGTAFRNERSQTAVVGTVFLARACVFFKVLTHLAASVPHILRIIVGRLEALAGGVDPAQLSAVVSHKQLSCKMKRQSATCHDTPGG